MTWLSIICFFVLTIIFVPQISISFVQIKFLRSCFENTVICSKFKYVWLGVYHGQLFAPFNFAGMVFKTMIGKSIFLDWRGKVLRKFRGMPQCCLYIIEYEMYLPRCQNIMGILVSISWTKYLLCNQQCSFLFVYGDCVR